MLQAQVIPTGQKNQTKRKVVVGAWSAFIMQFVSPRTFVRRSGRSNLLFQMVGNAVAPAILGLAQNSAPDLESGLKLVFLVGAVSMAVAFLMFLTIPEISLESEV